MTAVIVPRRAVLSRSGRGGAFARTATGGVVRLCHGAPGASRPDRAKRGGFRVTTLHIETQAGQGSGPYRERWDWDEVRWASHCIDCYPGNCPMRVYLKDGKLIREESAATFPTYEPGVRDMNPMGCQRGVALSRMVKGEERVLYPLKRVGSHITEL